MLCLKFKRWDACLQIWEKCLPHGQDANRMPRLTEITTYIQRSVQTLMDSKSPEEEILRCDRKWNCGKQRHDGEHRGQTQERTLHPFGQNCIRIQEILLEFIRNDPKNSGFWNSRRNSEKTSLKSEQYSMKNTVFCKILNKNAKSFTKFRWNIWDLSGAKHVNIVDLVKRLPTNIFLQKLASIQKRTSPPKFDHLAEKSE